MEPTKEGPMPKLMTCPSVLLRRAVADCMEVERRSAAGEPVALNMMYWAVWDKGVCRACMAGATYYLAGMCRNFEDVGPSDIDNKSWEVMVDTLRRGVVPPFVLDLLEDDELEDVSTFINKGREEHGLHYLKHYRFPWEFYLELADKLEGYGL